jgi:hypothetical protein
MEAESRNAGVMERAFPQVMGQVADVRAKQAAKNPIGSRKKCQASQKLIDSSKKCQGTTLVVPIRQ